MNPFRTTLNLLVASLGLALPLANQLHAGTLAEALDAPGLTWTTGGDAPWFYQTTNTYNGLDAAQSGATTNYWATTWLETSVTGRVTVLYRWRISSDRTWYTYQLNTNGNWASYLYDQADWQLGMVSFGGGSNLLRWTYTVPGAGAPGWQANAAWLDQVVVTNIAGLKPTFIVSPPSAINAPEYSPTSSNLTATVIGDIPITYQWQRSGTNLSEAWPFYNVTSPSLTYYPRTQAETGGNLRLVASNAWGMTTSTVCTLTIVPSPPIIPSYSPPDSLIAAGANSGPYVSVYGSPPVSYQWLKSGNPIPGSTQYYHPLWSATLADSGSYSVIVTNLYGAATSRVAQVTVSTALPSILSGPDPEVSEQLPGAYASFWAQAAGPEPITYSWSRVGDPAEWGTSSTMAIGNVDPTNSGLYQLILTNQNGAVTSRVAVLAVAPVTALGVALDAPQLTVTNDFGWYPWTVDVTGTNAHDRLCAARSPQIWDWSAAPFSTVITGPTNVSFWWRISAAAEAYLDLAVDGAVSNTISGETAWRKQSLALEAGEHTLTWTFRKNNAGSAGADAAWVDQFALGDGNSSSNSSVLLTNFTTGGHADWYLQTSHTHASSNAWQSGLIYAWQQSWLRAPVTGPGTLSFWWKVSSAECCSLLTFNVDGTWQTNIAGEVAWQQVSLPLGPGQHQLDWIYLKTDSTSSGHDAGWVAEATFTPSGTAPPFIVTEPVGGAYPVGSAIALSVSAEGSPPLRYQWLHDDTPIPGAVTATNTIPYATLADAGAYRVTITNDYGSVTSVVATLTIYPLITIVSMPTNVTVGVGGTAQFSISATGAAPLSYAWYKDGWIAGATNNTLLLTNVQTTNAGTYWVAVNDAYGNQVWASATLTVSSPPVITAQPVGGFGFSGSVILSSVTATGAPPLVFRWQRGGSDVPGATSNVLKIVNAQPADSGSYRALVSNAAGSVTSLVAAITITNPPPGAAPGTLDPTYLTGLGANGGLAERVALQSDGKAIVAGRFTSVNGVPAVGLARINPDGAYDPTFVTTTGLDGGVRAVVVLPDDRILIGGYFTQVQGVRRQAVARLLPNGTVDPTFDPGAGPVDSVTSLAVQADGKVLVGGHFDSFSGVVAMGLARLQTNGVVDATFISTNAPNGRMAALAVQPDGKILLGGNFDHLAGANRFGFARVHANGLLDTSFVPALTGGPQASQGSTVARILVLPDNRILAAGWMHTSPSQPIVGLLRFEANGALDPSFQTTASRGLEYTAMCRQPDGKLLISGVGQSGTGFPLTFARRLSANGVPDPSFQPTTNMMFFSGPPVLFTFAQDFALRPDGRLLAVGEFSFVKTVGHQLAQFQTNGVVDPTFLPGKGSDLAVLALAPRPDGRFVVGGDFTLFNHRLAPRVARLNADASLDASFVTTEGPNNSVRALGVQSDERVVLGGTFTAMGSNALAGLARLNADGSFNAAFQAQLGPTSVVNTLVIQPDDKIVLGGQFNLVNGSVRANLARLEASGALDPSFNLGTGFNAPVTVVLRQADGKLLVAGSFTNVAGVARLYLARLNDNGSLDASFNPGTNAPGPLSALALAPDGKIVVAASAYIGARNRIARLNPDGSADLTFGGYGADSISTLAVQPDGRILVLGNFRWYVDANEISKSLGGLARLNADGSIDEGFDLGEVGGLINFAAVAQLPDGRLLIGGGFSAIGGVGRDNLARVNTENFAGLPPWITTQPYGASRVAGSPWALQVTASGSLPLAYQWRKNGVALPNATSSRLDFSPLVTADTGEYDLVVTNAYGTARSFLAQLNVAPLVLHPPQWDPARGVLWLTWNSADGTRHRLERWNSPDLGTTGSPAWVLVATVWANSGGGSYWGITVPPGSATGFYRVVTVP